MSAVIPEEISPFACLPYPMPADVRVVCSCETIAAPEPWILLALALALLGAVALGYAVGRTRRLRAKLRTREGAL